MNCQASGCRRRYRHAPVILCRLGVVFWAFRQAHASGLIPLPFEIVDILAEPIDRLLERQNNLGDDLCGRSFDDLHPGFNERCYFTAGHAKGPTDWGEARKRHRIWGLVNPSCHPESGSPAHCQTTQPQEPDSHHQPRRGFRDPPIWATARLPP